MPALPMSSRPDGGVVALGPGPIDEPDGDDPEVSGAAEEATLDAALRGVVPGGVVLGGVVLDGADPVTVVSTCPVTCWPVAARPAPEVQPAVSRHTTASTSFDPPRRLRPLATTAR